jgi:hypothetical protein
VRKSPLNYVLTLALLAVLWIAGAIFAGNYLRDNAALANVTTDAFELVYRVVMTIAVVVGTVGLSHWYWYGAKDSTAANLRGARRFWIVWFLMLIVASVATVAGLVITFMSETFTGTEYLIMLGCASALTWIPFWICSLILSPRGVTRVPLGMK